MSKVLLKFVYYCKLDFVEGEERFEEVDFLLRKQVNKLTSNAPPPHPLFFIFMVIQYNPPPLYMSLNKIALLVLGNFLLWNLILEKEILLSSKLYL